MDPVRNPFAPGAGTPPPELTGRDELIASVDIALQRVKLCKPTKSMIVIGLRGVGKTVLLDRFRLCALNHDIETMRIEAPESRSLPAILAPSLRQVLLKLSITERGRATALRGLRALAGFVGALKLTYSDIDMRFDYQSEPGLADNGDLEHDLQALLEVVGEAARSAGTAVAMFIDELQYVQEDQLAALVTALHRAAQQQLPVVLFGAGLPQLPGQMGKAKSYAERLFDFPQIGPLSRDHATAAIRNPAREQGVVFTDEALDSIFEQTQGYPYFLQEWGKHCWDFAQASPVTIDDVEQASNATITALDESFFRVRLDRLTPTEKQYLRAMAELGPGPHKSGDVAGVLRRTAQSIAPVRSKLIHKGMVYSPTHGDIAFTVPLFDAFMRRTVPELEID